MDEIFTKISDFWSNEADPRAKEFFILKTPFPILSILVIYFATLKFLIPAATNNKRHPHLGHLLSIYYVIHSLISFVCIYFWFYLTIKINFNYRCHPIDHSDSFYSRMIILYASLFIWFKFSEMIESFLLAIVNGKAPIFNILHHTLYPCMLAVGMRFYPGGSPAFFPLVNCIEHTLLYLVLALRQMSPKFRKNCTWFKKFHIILSILAMVVSIAFYIQMETRDDCNFTVFRYYILTCLFLFSFCGIYFRWSYIIQDDAFGQTWFAHVLRNAKLHSKNALLMSKSNGNPFIIGNSEKIVETKLMEAV